MKSWIFLLIAGVFEVGWATSLKLSEGFTRLNYSLLTFIGMAISFYFLAQATKTLPIGVSYAIWTGIGAFGATLVGALLFKEPLTMARVFFVLLLLIGIMGLKWTSAS